jgi:hypothetical protein
MSIWEALIKWEVLINLLVTLFGTFVGVYWAFWLDRRQQEARAKKGYANTLNSIRADTANLGAICRGVAEHIGQSEVKTALLPIEAPALEAALASPAFYERAPYGLLTCLIVLATSRRGIQKVLAQSQLPPPSELKPMVEQLGRGLAYIGKVLDDEIKPLGSPIVSTPHDKQVIEGLKAAQRGENAQMGST